MPKTAMANGSHAVIGTGRRSWMDGSTRRATRRFQPTKSPSGMPTAAASRKPCSTRRDEYSTAASQVPEYGESDLTGVPKIQRCQDCATCSGDGMMPSVTQCWWTAAVHSARNPSGRSAGHRRRTTLLVLAELDRRLPRRLGQEVVGVVLRDLAGDVARDDAVVGEELRDALDRLQRQRGVELGDPDGLGGHRLGQARLLGIDLRPAG